MKPLLAIIFTAISITGCIGNEGDEFIGNWVNAKNSKHTWQITRQGKAIVINEVVPSDWNGARKKLVIPSTMNQGVLAINYPGAMATFNAVVANDGTIQVADRVFIRTTPEAVAANEAGIAEDAKSIGNRPRWR